MEVCDLERPTTLANTTGIYICDLIVAKGDVKLAGGRKVPRGTAYVYHPAGQPLELQPDNNTRPLVLLMTVAMEA